MKLNLNLLIFAFLLIIAFIGVKNSSLSKRDLKKHHFMPVNFCLDADWEEIEAEYYKNKNLKNPEEKLSANLKKFQNAGKLAVTIKKLFNNPPGIPIDLSERDLKNEIKINLKMDEKANNELKNMLNNKEGFPLSLDWVEQSPKCFGNISEQQQGSCGSCFIFAPVNYFSILRCLNTETEILNPLSTQDVVSCMKQNERNNCQGGSPKNVWDYLHKNGVVSHSCKCYKDHDYENITETVKPGTDLFSKKKPNSKQGLVEECKNVCDDPSMIPTHFKPEVPEMLVTNNQGKIISSLVNNYGILIANIVYKPDFKKFIDESEKDQELTDLNSGVRLSMLLMLLYPKLNPKNHGHAIIIVGYKLRTDDRCKKELVDENSSAYNCVYFKILNSWGKNFGKNGYAYIPDTFIHSTYLGFSNKDQVKRFINDTILKKDIYTFSKDRKYDLKIEDLFKHYLS